MSEPQKLSVPGGGLDQDQGGAGLCQKGQKSPVRKSSLVTVKKPVRKTSFVSFDENRTTIGTQEGTEDVEDREPASPGPQREKDKYGDEGKHNKC